MRKRYEFAGRPAVLVAVFLAGLAAGYLIAIQLSSFAAIPANDRDYFPEVYSLMASANQSIHVAMFEAKYYRGHPDSQSDLLLKLLVNKSRRVDVKVYVDSLFNVSQSGYEYLRGHGVNTRYGGPATTHAKLIIIDSKYVVIGSTNWGYYSLEKNHEASVIIKSPGLASLYEAYFRQVWSEAGQKRGS